MIINYIKYISFFFMAFFFTKCNNIEKENSENLLFNDFMANNSKNKHWTDPKVLDNYKQFIDKHYDFNLQSNAYDPYLFVFNEPVLYEKLEGFYIRVIMKSLYFESVLFSVVEKKKWTELNLKIAKNNKELNSDNKDYMVSSHQYIKSPNYIDSIKVRIEKINFKNIRYKKYDPDKRENITLEILKNGNYYYYGDAFGGHYESRNIDEKKLQALFRDIATEVNFNSLKDLDKNLIPIELNSWSGLKEYSPLSK